MRVQGKRIPGGVEIIVNGEQLLPGESRKIRDHSNKFNYGYGGNGPAQLALALCLRFGLTEEEALKHYQNFKWEVIAKLHDQFDMDMEIPSFPFNVTIHSNNKISL
jgi:hypothetical protein